MQTYPRRIPQGDIPGAPCRLSLAPHCLSPAPREGLFGQRGWGGTTTRESSTQRQGHRFYFADRSVNPKVNPTYLLQVSRWESRGAERLRAEHPTAGRLPLGRVRDGAVEEEGCPGIPLGMWGR